MLSPNRAYVIGASGVVISRGISAVAGVVSLWLLARILTTEQLAGYVVAMSVLTLVGYNAGLAIERAMVLRLAALPVRQDYLAGRSMMLRTLLFTVALSLFSMGAVVAYAKAGDDTGAWLIVMAPMIPAITIGITLAAWFHANHRVGTSVMMQGVTDGARCLFFIFVFWASLGPTAVAYSAVFATALPIFILTFMALGKSGAAPCNLRISDLGAGMQFLVLRLSQMGLRQFDILIVGLFTGPLETAQYAVAARMSVIASVGHSAFSTTYIPRLRRHLASEDQSAIQREFEAARLLAFLMTFAAALVFYMYGEAVLGLFGDFKGGYNALVILMAAHIMTAAFSLHNDHLSMSGDLRLAVLIRSGTTIVFVITLLILVPKYSILGASLAAAFAAVVFGAMGALALRLRAGPTLRSPVLTLAASAATGAIITGALFPKAWTAGLGILVMSLVVVLWVERALPFQIFRRA